MDRSREGDAVSDIGRFLEDGLHLWTKDGRKFKVTARFHFVRPNYVGGDTITVLEDSETDFASVPVALDILGIDRADEKVLMPSATHDAGYRGKVLVNGLPTLLDKQTCDLIFLEGMRAKGMADLKARTYFNGVAELGQESFDEDRKALEAREGQKGTP